MVVLVDANVVIDFIGRREDFEAADALMEKCANHELQGYIAFHSISIIWYILRKTPPEKRRVWMAKICKILTVTGAPHELVVQAIENDRFLDFEDCLQSKCAEAIEADYIVTRNVRDYQDSAIKAITPAELLAM